MWRLAKHSVPSAEVLHHRNMATIGACTLCGVHDTWRHALLNSPVSRSTWALSSEGILYQLSVHQEEDAREWISIKAELSSDDFIKFVVTLWAIWGARRKAIYEGIFKTPHAIHGFVSSYLLDIQVLSTSRPIPSTTVTHPTGWLAPPDSHVKLNVDGAVGGRSKFGAVGAICRSHDGTFLGASVCVFTNITDPATLETLAIREGLALAGDLHEDRVHIATDCKG